MRGIADKHFRVRGGALDAVRAIGIDHAQLLGKAVNVANGLRADAERLGRMRLQRRLGHRLVLKLFPPAEMEDGRALGQFQSHAQARSAATTWQYSTNV